jgi:hypothetical protein
MEKVNKEFVEVIREYLEKRSEKDALFSEKYKSSKKTVEQCCDYIISEARKRGSRAVVICHEEVFGMAVHFFDEDGIQPVEPAVDTSVIVPERKPAEKKETVESSKKDVVPEHIENIFELL